MNADVTADSIARRPRLTLASAVMFVGDLDRSVAFYQDLLGLEATARDDDAALLVSPGGYQLYLRTMGERAPHFSGNIGIQFLIWTCRGNFPRPRPGTTARDHETDLRLLRVPHPHGNRRQSRSRP